MALNKRIIIVAGVTVFFVAVLVVVWLFFFKGKPGLINLPKTGQELISDRLQNIEFSGFSFFGLSGIELDSFGELVYEAKLFLRPAMPETLFENIILD